MLYHKAQEKKYAQNAKTIVHEVCGDNYYTSENWDDIHNIYDVDGIKMFELRVKSPEHNQYFPWRGSSSIFVPIGIFENPEEESAKVELQEVKSRWYKLLAEQDEERRKRERERALELKEEKEKQKVAEENKKYIQYLELKKQYEK